MLWRVRRRLDAHRGWSRAGGLRVRRYRDYRDYAEHQRSKTALIGDLEAVDARVYEALVRRLPAVDGAVLCLGARAGGEVRALRALGAAAFGVDLLPAGDGVFAADFHALPVRSGSLGAVYTNSLDHAFDLGRVLGEARRALRPDGQLIVDAVAGMREGVLPGPWEATFWRRVDELADFVDRAGFVPRSDEPFDEPWPGRMLTFTPRA